MPPKSSPFVDSCIYAIAGLPIGLFVGAFIPSVVFHTTKPLHFMDGTWFIGITLMVAATLSFSAWVKKSKRISVRRIIFASLIGVSAACLIAFPVSVWFSDAHKNYWESMERFGDFFGWITPLSYLIFSVGVIAYFLVLLIPTRDPQAQTS